MLGSQIVSYRRRFQYLFLTLSLLVASITIVLTGCDSGMEDDEPAKERLTVVKEGAGTGTVTGSGINCGSDCTEEYDRDATVVLTATPSTGSNVESWAGCDAVVNNTCTVNVSSDRSVTVTFSATQSFTLTTAVSGLGAVSRDPLQTNYSAGTEVELTAVPQPGHSFSRWSGGITGTQNPVTVTINSNVTITAAFVEEEKTLTVITAGIGSGTITGAGINCGADCTEDFQSGDTVVLTATPSSGSAFGSWAECDTVADNTCTVEMTASKTVTATFNLAISSIAPSVTVPSSSTTGNYDVTVECTGLCSNIRFLEEAPTVAFDNATRTTFTNSPNPLVVSFTGKAPGTYCYRAALSVPNWGDAACVTVSPPSTSVLRITNNSSYDIIDVRLNNIQQANYPYGIAAGESVDFVFTSGGSVSYALGNGFYNSNQSRNIWFTLTGSTNVSVGQTTTITFNNPTIGQLLSNFATAKNWDGQYWDNNLNPLFRRFRFSSSNNGWTLFDSTAPCFGGTTCSYSETASGTVRLVSWPRYSSIVTFDFGPGTESANILFPFATFKYRNGPGSWPIIEYIGQ